MSRTIFYKEQFLWLSEQGIESEVIEVEVELVRMNNANNIISVATCGQKFIV